MRERVIEKYLCQQIEALGGKAIKLTSSGNAGLHDRLCILPYRVVLFVEVKAPGKKPRKLQKAWHHIMKSMHQYSVYVDSRPQVDALAKWYLRFRDRFRKRVEEEI